MSQLFDKTTNVLSAALDLYMLRHSLISDNIANAETPGFKARRIEFEGELARVLDEHKKGAVDLEARPQRSLASVRPLIYEDPQAEVGQDRNTVDMDREMAALAKNDMKYSAATESIGRKFALLKYAIGEGNK